MVLKNTDWEIMEYRVTNWFRTNRYDARKMPVHNKYYDILVNDTYRIDVKYSIGKSRNPNELQFHLKLKDNGRDKVDFYLLSFKDDGKYCEYLVPSAHFNNVNYFTITKNSLPDWLKKYEFNRKTVGLWIGYPPKDAKPKYKICKKIA